MVFSSVLVCQVEKLLCTPISFAVFAFLFMACTMEVVLLKLTTSAHIFGRPPNHDDWRDDGNENEEEIYYENLQNNYEQWARRRMRYHQRRQQQQLLLAQQQQL